MDTVEPSAYHDGLSRNTMRVLINAAGANIGGAITYLTNVIRELSRVSDDPLFVMAPPDVLHGLPPGSWVSIPYPHQPQHMFRRLYFDQVSVRRVIRERGIDVLFSSNGFGTFRCPCPQVLLIRNTLYFSDTLEDRYRRRRLPTLWIRLRRHWSLLSIRSADLVLFPTRATLDLVSRRANLRSKSTRVIPYGFDRDSFFAPDAPVPEICARMKQWKDTGHDILLSVSAYAVHKNLETLVEALPSLLALGFKIKLVLTIERDTAAEKREFDALLERVRNLGLSETVALAGHLRHEQLHHLYQRADVFVFPSFTESFGHPMVEAMACGLPVVAAGTAVNREVLGRAGVYFETFEPDNCAAAIAEVLRNAPLRDQARRHSRQEIQRFSWNAHAFRLHEAMMALHDATRSRGFGGPDAR